MSVYARRIYIKNSLIKSAILGCVSLIFKVFDTRFAKVVKSAKILVLADYFTSKLNFA